MAGLDSLTALNLERNAIQKLQRDIFDGVNDTLSSLSLLNNLLTEYPIEAINAIKELRVSYILKVFDSQCKKFRDIKHKDHYGNYNLKFISNFDFF